MFESHSKTVGNIGLWISGVERKETVRTQKVITHRQTDTHTHTDRQTHTHTETDRHTDI